MYLINFIYLVKLSFRGYLVKIYDLTPEGKIISALIGGGLSFNGLLKETGLSGRWLTLKLKELVRLGVVTQSLDKQYRLNHWKLQELVAKDLGSIARLIALELAGNMGVIAVILFGSVAKARAKTESDIDLLVVTEEAVPLSDVISNLMVKFNVQIEAVTVTFHELLTALRIKPPLLFGIIEGYEVLFDRGGVASILKTVEMDVKREWFHDEEVDIWVKKTLRPIWKTQGST